MKIAVFCDSYKPYISGVVRSVESFAKELVLLGHHLYIFAPGYRGRDGSPPTDPVIAHLGEEERGTGSLQIFRFLSIPAPTYTGFSLAIPFSPRLDSHLSRLEIDVIHTHSPFLLGRLGAAAARRHKLPLVFTYHTLYHEYIHYLPMGRRLMQQLVKNSVSRYCRRCDLVIVPSPEMGRFVSQEHGEDIKTVVIPTGIPVHGFARGDDGWLRKRWGIPPDHRILLFVGRLGQEKNVGLLLEMLARVVRRRPEVRLVLVGGGPAKEELERLALCLGIAGMVTFAGRVPFEGVASYYAGADLFVFPSLTETQGIVLLEAMAARLPVVSVEAHGTKGFLTHGRDGYVVSPEAGEFAERVLELLEDPAKREALAQSGLEKAESMSSSRMAQRLVEVYRTLLPKTPL